MCKETICKECGRQMIYRHWGEEYELDGYYCPFCEPEYFDLPVSAIKEIKKEKQSK